MYCPGEGTKSRRAICFAALILIMWCCYFLTRALRRVVFEIETIAFFLCSIGFAVTASSAPDSLYKQTVCLILGLLLFYVLNWFLRDLDRIKKLRWPIAAAGLVLLMVNLSSVMRCSVPRTG